LIRVFAPTTASLLATPDRRHLLCPAAQLDQSPSFVLNDVALTRFDHTIRFPTRQFSFGTFNDIVSAAH
jgi:hypothetical protein